MLHPWWQQWDRGAHPAHPPVLLVLLSHPQLPRLGLKAPHDAVVLSAFVGGFSKCNSLGSGVGVAGSGPCQAHLLQGSVDRPQCSSQGDVLRSSCLWQIQPSALHLLWCTSLNKVLGKDQHSPFSGPEHHLPPLPVPVQWLGG